MFAQGLFKGRSVSIHVAAILRKNPHCPNYRVCFIVRVKISYLFLKIICFHWFDSAGFVSKLELS